MDALISRRTFVNATAGTLAGLGLASALPAALEAGTALASEPGTFTMAVNTIPSAFIPTTLDDDRAMVTRPVFEPLFQETFGDQIEYHLADRFEISPDGLTYTIHIRDDANWSDGKPVTVADVLLYHDLNTVIYGYPASTTVDGGAVTVNQIDDKTFELVLPSVYTAYIKTICSWFPLPAHAFDGDASQILGAKAAYLATPGMATSGAYTVEQINEDSIVFKARDDYYGGELQVKTLVMRTIGAGATRRLAFENGEIDYMRITTAEDLATYANDPAYTVYSVPESRLNYLQINPQGPLSSTLSDDARRALFLALDGQQIVDFAYGSDELATPANSLMNPEQKPYNPACPGYTQDLETAKQLAQSSGLAGQTLTYIFNAARDNMEQIAVVVQQQLAAIGVNLQIEALDATSFFARFFTNAADPAANQSWDLATNGLDSERGMSARSFFTYLTTSTSTGFSEDLAALSRQANATTDPDEAQELWYEAQDRALEECWAYPLTYTNYVMVSRTNVSGLDASPIIPEFSLFSAIKVE